jgi:hypothetical protein
MEPFALFLFSLNQFQEIYLILYICPGASLRKNAAGIGLSLTTKLLWKFFSIYHLHQLRVAGIASQKYFMLRYFHVCLKFIFEVLLKKYWCVQKEAAS